MKYEEQLDWMRILGILSMVFIPAIMVLDFIAGKTHTPFIIGLDLVLSAVATVCYSLFLYAFIIIDRKFSGRLTTILWLTIILGALITVVGNLPFVLPKLQGVSGLIIILLQVPIGILLILFGIRIRKMTAELGPLARTCGTVHIVAGALAASIILFFFGALVSLAGDIYLILILGAYIKKLRASTDAQVVGP